MISLPKNTAQKKKVLDKVAELIEYNREYTEEEINQIIQLFDVEDHVLLRRELVNFDYLAKDSYKGVYWRKELF